MCGIVGVYQFSHGSAVDPEVLTRMRDCLVHRGPDDAGSYLDGPVGIGMRRLAIIDIRTGHQPLSNEDDSAWIVFNGEIYNHDELRRRLKGAGHRFRTTTDTEVILHLYEDHGVDCLQYLRGMFAFAIWDNRRRQIFVARDRLGIKPLYWTRDGDRFAFASELKALLVLPGIAGEVNWTAIDAYFAYGYIPAPLSAYQSVSKLPAAHYLLVNAAGVTTHRYWSLPVGPKLRGSEARIASDFRDLFEETVRMHLMSEVPLGAFLSGGVDSGLAVAMMSRHSASPVSTFTIGFGGGTGSFLDERPIAAEVASMYGCRHHEYEVQPDVEEALAIGTRAFDEPFADDSLIPTHHICRLAREHVTVVLTGLGGDEDFAGYERYLGLLHSGIYARFPALLRDRIIAPLIRALPEEKGGHYRINHLKRFVAGGDLDASLRYQSYLCALPEALRRRLYSPEVARRINFEEVEDLGRRHFDSVPEGDLLDRALSQDVNAYLPEDVLALTDRVGMQHSLELRVPFVDHELVEYCARIPSRMKIRSWTKKYLLKQVARPYLPPSVFSHRKQGFASPMAAWLNTDLKGLVENHLSPRRLERDGFFSPTAVTSLVEDHRSRRSLHDKSIFSLLVFQRWLSGQSAIPQLPKASTLPMPRASRRPSAKATWVSWEHHRRSRSLTEELQIPYHFLLPRHRRIFRYPSFAVHTMALLCRERPDVLFVQNPSLMLALTALGLRSLLRYRLVVDAHNAAVRPEGVYRPFSFMYGHVQRRADLTIVTNAGLAATVAAHGGRTLILPDALPTFGRLAPSPRPHGSVVTYVCTFGHDEPWREALAAARNLPDGSVMHITGDNTRVHLKDDPIVHPNVHLTGYMPDDEYVSLLAASDVVMDLTQREDCLVCGAYEAVSLGVPLVLSDTPALRRYFRRGAVYTDNTAPGIAAALREALANRDSLRTEIARLRDEIRGEWEQQFLGLLDYLDSCRRPSADSQWVPSEQP
jgi:asparagine synthase (glutamine-hydrolysing)